LERLRLRAVGKRYDVPADADKRYSPAECTGIEKQAVFGKPKIEDVARRMWSTCI
jgi:hypothetical protein